MSEIVYSTAQLVGHTPLMELVNYEAVHGITAHLLAKLESYNPSGSIKDRAALQMIREAERRGDILPGDTIVEQTSGNTGIAIAALAIPMGYQVEIFLERGASLERREMLEAFGVKLLTYRDALGIRTDAEREAGWQEPEREATLAEICGSRPVEKWMYWYAWRARAARCWAFRHICGRRILLSV